MSKVDIVYFMKGWENARGCKIENKICQAYGRQTIYNIYEEGEKNSGTRHERKTNI